MLRENRIEEESGAASPRASTGYTPSFPVVHGAGQPGGRIEFGNMASCSARKGYLKQTTQCWW